MDKVADGKLQKPTQKLLGNKKKKKPRPSEGKAGASTGCEREEIAHLGIFAHCFTTAQISTRQEILLQHLRLLTTLHLLSVNRQDRRNWRCEPSFACCWLVEHSLDLTRTCFVFSGLICGVFTCCAIHSVPLLSVGTRTRPGQATIVVMRASPTALSLSPATMIPRGSHKQGVLLPPSLTKFLYGIKGAEPAPWYAELEAIHSLVPLKDWTDLRVYWAPRIVKYVALSAEKKLQYDKKDCSTRDAYDGYMSAPPSSFSLLNSLTSVSPPL